MDAIIKDCNFRQETEIKAKAHTFTQEKKEKLNKRVPLFALYTPQSDH